MQKVNKACEISDAKIQFVSLVDKAANKRQFLLKKEDEGKATFTTYGRIIKTDMENHYVTGIVYEPMEEDSHGNYMTAEEITKAAYWFAKNGDKVDLQHSFEPLESALVVENWVAKADFKIGDEVVKKGTWLMTVEVSDEKVWDDIEKGEITGFSMGGLGNYSEEDVELDKIEKNQETIEKKGLLSQIAKALGIKVVEKGAMAELYDERSKGTLFWDAFHSLQDVMQRYDNITGRWVYETDENKVRECLEDFSRIITSVLTGKESIVKTIHEAKPIEKAGKKMSSKNKETLQNVYDNLGTLLAAVNEDTDAAEDGDTKDDKNKKEDTKVTKQEIGAIVAESIQKALEAKENGEKLSKQEASGDVKKAEGNITPEDINAMVETAVAKALQPKQETVTAEQVQEMISKAVSEAVEPILKSRGLPNNLNGSGAIEKSEDHYMCGLL